MSRSYIVSVLHSPRTDQQVVRCRECTRVLSSDDPQDSTVQGAVLALWRQGKGALKLPGLGCPVVTIHEVALEDLVDELLPAAFGHLRAAYDASPSSDTECWLTQ